MDTSETYIKMCDCPEIQGQCMWELADRVATRIRFVPEPKYMPLISKVNLYRVYLNIGYDMEKEVAKEICIWLPRQDQLQEMLHKSVGSKGFILVTYFVDQMRKGILDDSQMDLTSMEQLWLAFVMKEKYGKTWNGESWNG